MFSSIDPCTSPIVQVFSPRIDFALAFIYMHVIQPPIAGDQSAPSVHVQLARQPISVCYRFACGYALVHFLSEIFIPAFWIAKSESIFKLASFLNPSTMSDCTTMTAEVLRLICQQKRLPIPGSRQQLIARLKDQPPPAAAKRSTGPPSTQSKRSRSSSQVPENSTDSNEDANQAAQDS